MRQPIQSPAPGRRCPTSLRIFQSDRGLIAVVYAIVFTQKKKKMTSHGTGDIKGHTERIQHTKPREHIEGEEELPKGFPIEKTERKADRGGEKHQPLVNPGMTGHNSKGQHGHSKGSSAR